MLLLRTGQRSSVEMLETRGRDREGVARARGEILVSLANIYIYGGMVDSVYI